MVNPSLGRLLIVDDEAKLMAVLCELLTKHGYDAVGFIPVEIMPRCSLRARGPLGGGYSGVRF